MGVFGGYVNLVCDVAGRQVNLNVVDLNLVDGMSAVDPADATELIAPALAAVEQERPGIATPPIRLVDMGFSSYVFATGSGYIVRVARTPQAASGQRRECELLPRLAGLLPVAVPVPEWRLEPGTTSRFGAMAYARIDGRMLPRDARCLARLVTQLASVLVRVHGIDREAVAAGVTSLDEWKQATISWVTRAVDHLTGEVSAAEHARLVRWRERFVAHVERLSDDTAVVIHGDLWHDNILIRDDEIVGVLDWESAAITDPAADLAPVWDIDDEMGKALVRTYQHMTSPDPSLADRVRLFRVARSVSGITWCLENNDLEEYRESLAKVRRVLPLT